ncbi:MAG: hypothetical protein QM632_02555 [Micrococcaceae bacterium]
MSLKLQTKKPKALIGPLTLRDIVVLLTTIGLLITSFYPMYKMRISNLQGPLTMWQSGPMIFIPGVLLAVFATFLLLYRRFAHSELRLGSFSTDQLASIAGVVTLLFYATLPFTLFAWSRITSIADGSEVMSFQTTTALYIAMGLSLLFLLATTFAPKIPFFATDFAGRHELDAHPVARSSASTAKAVTTTTTQTTTSSNPQTVTHQHRGKAAAAGLGASVAGTAAIASHQQRAQQQETATPHAYQARTASQLLGQDQQQATRVHHQQQATTVHQQQQAQQQTVQTTQATQQTATQNHNAENAQQPFWFAVPETRQIVDENTGKTALLIPGEWHLALEDHGNSFLAQAGDTGDTGTLHNINDIQRA